MNYQQCLQTFRAKNLILKPIVFVKIASKNSLNFSVISLKIDDYND